MRERVLLMREVPTLRAAFLLDMARSVQLMEHLVARRAGRDSRDFAVRTFTGAVLGVMLSICFHWAENPETDSPSP